MSSSYPYESEDEAVRILSSPAPATRAIALHGEEILLLKIREPISLYRRSDGSYLFENLFRFVIAKV